MMRSRKNKCHTLIKKNDKLELSIHHKNKNVLN